MLRATSIVRRPAVRPERVVDTVTLDHEARHRRRVAMTAEGGLSFLLDLERATALDDGDALRLEDGRLIQVRAAPERLIEVTTGNPLRLMRVAWHIGNRHVPAEIAEDALYLGYDHVLLEMIRGLGASARVVERPFRPERGAYAGEGDAVHAHGHSHGHDHGGPGAHAHEGGGHAGHGHGHRADACGCGHAHGASSHADAHGAHSHAHGASAHAHAHGAEAHAAAGGHACAESHAQSHTHGHAYAHGQSHAHGHAHAHSHVGTGAAAGRPPGEG